MPHELSVHPEFIAGREDLKTSNFESAIDNFSRLLQRLIESYGEDAEEVASAWYEYGNALLQKEEENPSYGLLGSATEKEVEAKAAKEAEMEGNVIGITSIVSTDEVDVEGNVEGVEVHHQEEDAGGDDEGNDEDALAENEDEPDDLQIAFEALENARRLYEAHASEKSDERLAEIRVRIGDLKRFNNDEIGAIEEYKVALDIRNSICEPYERDISEVHFNLAQAYIYHANDSENPLVSRRAALNHYKQCKAVLSLFVQKAIGSTMAHEPQPKCMCQSCTNNVVELEKEVQEHVDALQEEIACEEKSGNNGKTASGSLGVTSIGFGAPVASSSSSSALASSSSSSLSSSSSSSGSFAFGSANVPVVFSIQPKSTHLPPKDVTNVGSSSELGKREIAEVNVMQAKKKIKPTQVLSGPNSSASAATPAE